ncbi:MAG: hydroxymethylpyrimidine/phosphomethylpyrimidine kinase, partial [Candidatus Altiarchaeota archaeon]
MKKILTIAGSDPSGGAGIQRDLAVFTELGCYGLSAVTAVTSQNTRGVKESYTVPAQTVKAQITTIFADLPPDAVKTGMLASKENTEEVYKTLKKEKVGILVVDPVIKSSTGYALLEEDALDAMRKLVDIATISTPNVREAQVLSGVRIKSAEDMREAAEEIGDCVITGGDEDAKDLLYYEGEYAEFPGLKK